MKILSYTAPFLCTLLSCSVTFGAGAHPVPNAPALRVAAGVLPVAILAEVWRGNDPMDQPRVKKFMNEYDHPKKWNGDKQPRAQYYQNKPLDIRGKNLKQPRK